MDFDRDKFKALVLYVIWAAGERSDFGSTKLNKVLWFSEARVYEAYGRPITGETYIRQKFGPVPQHLVEVREELQNEGLITIWSEPLFDHQVTRFRAFEPPSTALFTQEELGFIDWWIRHVDEEHSATSISEKSHDYAWKIAKMGEVIPLYAFLASKIRDPKGESEIAWAQQEAERLGLK
jgi:hypothetical protein